MKLLTAVFHRLQCIEWRGVEQKLSQILSLDCMQPTSKHLSIQSMHGFHNQFKPTGYLWSTFGLMVSALDSCLWGWVWILHWSGFFFNAVLFGDSFFFVLNRFCSTFFTYVWAFPYYWLIRKFNVSFLNKLELLRSGMNPCICSQYQFIFV